jgi:hypothetical protein
MATEVNQAEYCRRCAWCERTLIRGNWLAEHDIADSDARALAVATHTICPACIEELRRNGQCV